VPDKIIKKILKVGLYTSLNGGCPFSDEQVAKSIKTNCSYLVPQGVKEEDYVTLPIFDCIKQCLSNFTLAKELGALNKQCYIQKDYSGDIVYQTYTPSRMDPWFIDAPHKGISRVLQGFEVVLLAALTREILLMGGVPLSLDHDGVFAGFKGEHDVHDIAKKLTKSLAPWAQYLLNSDIPVEVKRYFYKGEHYQFN